MLASQTQKLHNQTLLNISMIVISLNYLSSTIQILTLVRPWSFS